MNNSDIILRRSIAVQRVSMFLSSSSIRQFRFSFWTLAALFLFCLFFNNFCSAQTNAWTPVRIQSVISESGFALCSVQSSNGTATVYLSHCPQEALAARRDAQLGRARVRQIAAGLEERRREIKARDSVTATAGTVGPWVQARERVNADADQLENDIAKAEKYAEDVAQLERKAARIVVFVQPTGRVYGGIPVYECFSKIKVE